MLRRLLLLGVISFAVASNGSAHEIKVLASQLNMAKAGDKTTVYLSWGHRLPVDDLVDGKSIERFEVIGPSGSAQALKTDDLSLQANAVEIKDAGVSQAVVSRKIGIFTSVIDKEGNKLLKRGPKSTVKEGKIVSSLRSVQCGKAMIVVGAEKANPIKAVGQDIEIVPLDNPADWRNGNTLRFQVLLKGKALPTANLVATYVGFRPENAWCYSTSTGREGIASVRVTQPGTWVLKVNTKENAVGDALSDYDYTSYTATLAFEVR